MFAGSVSMASSLASRMAQQPAAAPAPAAQAHARPGGTATAEAGRRDAARGRAGPDEALRGGAVPGRSQDREPGRHLDGRAAAPAVRGVRPRHPHLRAHRRGDRLQDRGPALRPARARVHQAALGVVLAHRDLRRGADVHARHPVSEVHELHDERVLADVPALRRAVLRRGLLPLHLLLRLGEVPAPGPSRPGARPQRRGHGDHVHRQQPG